MSESNPLQGRTAIVTGASSGIGCAIMEHLAEAAAHLCFLDEPLRQLTFPIKTVY
jgi:NAD(P)-dependent dehydrogenase (short-subunit alcohol dehydrogenase family)